MRRHKYGARKTTCALNHPHPSALEAAVCALLQLREKARDISMLKWIASVDLGYGIRWKCDFSFLDRDGKPTWAEAKGAEDATYKHKIKMWRNGAGPGPIEIWKGTWQRPRLVEIVTPKALKCLAWLTLALLTTACTPAPARDRVRLTPIAQPASDVHYEWPGPTCGECAPCECHCETPNVTSEGETQ
jgi:hypothetical protein